MEKTEFETFQMLEGVKLVDDNISIPGYDLCRYDDWENYIMENLNEKQLTIYGSVQKHFNKSAVILGIKVLANDSKEATEKSRILSEKFENVLSYIIGDLKFQYSIGTKNIRKSQFSNVVTYNEKGFGFGSKTENIHLNYNLSQQELLNEELGYKYIWEVIGKKQTNNLQKRIIIAIEWIGKALWERDKTKTYMQLIIALESLLQFQEKTLISSSTANQISEWSAFISSDDSSQRLEIYKKVKKLYEIRSAIVHSGKSSLSIENISDAFQLIKKLITQLCTDQDYLKLGSIEELNGIIAKKRFS